MQFSKGNSRDLITIMYSSLHSKGISDKKEEDDFEFNLEDFADKT